MPGFRSTCSQSRDSRLLEIASEYRPGRGTGAVLSAEVVEEKTVEALFADFFADRTGGEAPVDETMALLALAGERGSRIGAIER